MTKNRRVLAALLALVLMLPLFTAYADEVLLPADEAPIPASFKQGGFASEGANAVYFLVAGTENTGLYSVPSVGGSISLLETQQEIKDVIAVGASVYYLRMASGSWQLVCRTGETLKVLQVFASGSVVSHLGYYDGRLYVVNNGWLFSFDAATGEETLVSEQMLTEYYILGSKIYFVSSEDQRTYQRAYTDGVTTLSVTAGCLYVMGLDGSEPSVVQEIGVSDLRGYGDYLYFHNYSDNYFVASSNGADKWLDGKLYRFSTVTRAIEQAYSNYDWDFYPTAYGVLLYTSQSLEMRDVINDISIQLMAPEIYTSVMVDGEFALVYEHTSQTITRLPVNGEAKVILGAMLPGSVAIPTTEEIGEFVEIGDGDALQPSATTAPAASATAKPSATKKPSGTYIFPESSTRKLTKADLKKVSPLLWAYGRNEIYAKHGYKFSKTQYAEYFAKQSWYTAGGFSTKDLNAIEWYNMEFIKSYEDLYKEEIEELRKNGGASSSSTKAPSATATTTPTDSTYIFPDSNTRKLTKEEILALDRSLWGYARNEIYARHGYKFTKAQYAEYFANKTWYKAGGFDKKDLNSIEWYNMDLIKQMEAKY